MMYDPEPEAHCYRCELAINGDCQEFKSLNPHYKNIGGYDRKGCHWGAKHQLRMILLDLNGKSVFDSSSALKEEAK
jgi:hypothetical protein